MSSDSALAVLEIDRAAVDLLVIGSGTGLAAALAARELGLEVAVAEKTALIGGSTARSGGAFWLPGNRVLMRDGSTDRAETAAMYVSAAARGSARTERWQRVLTDGDDAVALLERHTGLRLRWVRGYADYEPELPGGSPAGRSVEARPFNARVLGSHRRRLRGGVLEAPLPMAVTAVDYHRLNLLTKRPVSGLFSGAMRALQGIAGLAIGREYVAGGQALAAGLFAGVLRAGIPVWTEAALERLTVSGGAVTGAVLRQHGRERSVEARLGVVLAAGGFDHRMDWRRSYQAVGWEGDLSLGAAGNTGDAIEVATRVGAALENMHEAWWFPALAPVPGGQPQVLLAERSLPGSLIIDGNGRRFINESVGYMKFGQEVRRREANRDPVGAMWLIFDQAYRNSYLFAGQVFPRMRLPRAWYEHGVAHQAQSLTALADGIGVPAAALEATVDRFNAYADAGVDADFGRGDSAYDRYYGDPTVRPNPCLRALVGPRYYAVRVVLSDLGTCGGLRADADGRVLRDSGRPIPGLYAMGNAAANVFGDVYPGAGATIGQGLVYGTVIARHAASQRASGAGGAGAAAT